MGGFVADHAVNGVVTQLNDRFAPGDALKEMVAVEKEFSLFSGSHSLAHISRLLNIGPVHGRDRKGWFKFLDSLKDVPSDARGVNGHDRIVEELNRNLRSKNALPVFFAWHSERNVSVETGTPLSFSAQQYMIVTGPARAPR